MISSGNFPRTGGHMAQITRQLAKAARALEDHGRSQRPTSFVGGYAAAVRAHNSVLVGKKPRKKKYGGRVR